MKKPAPKKFTAREPKIDPRNWRESNPDYQPSEPQVSASGRIVVVDAGSLFDYVDGLRQQGIEK